MHGVFFSFSLRCCDFARVSGQCRIELGDTLLDTFPARRVPGVREPKWFAGKWITPHPDEKLAPGLSDFVALCKTPITEIDDA